jgi:hypothetical protein
MIKINRILATYIVAEGVLLQSNLLQFDPLPKGCAPTTGGLPRCGAVARQTAGPNPITLRNLPQVV